MRPSISTSCRTLFVSGFTAAALLVTAVPSAEASFARKLSGKVSRNPSIATQQLTADPPQTVDGTILVTYDPSLVTLYWPPQAASSNSAQFVQSPGFGITDIKIGVIEEGVPRFLDTGNFLDTGGPREELGQIYVSFGRLDAVASPVILPPQAGYGAYVTEPGYQQGDDTFGVIFYEKANYEGSTVFPDNPAVVSTFGLSIPQTGTLRYIPEGGTEPVTLLPSEVTPGSIAIPEPGSLGLIAVAGLALGMRRRPRS